MNTQSLDLNKMGLTPLSKLETSNIEGGDVDGTMMGKGVNLDTLSKEAAFAWGFVKGFFESL